MFFVKVDNGYDCDDEFTIVVKNERAAWHLYCAFSKLLETNDIAAWMTIMDSTDNFFIATGRNIVPMDYSIGVDHWKDYKIPLNSCAQKILDEQNT